MSEKADKPPDFPTNPSPSDLAFLAAKALSDKSEGWLDGEDAFQAVLFCFQSYELKEPQAQAEAGFCFALECEWLEARPAVLKILEPEYRVTAKGKAMLADGPPWQLALKEIPTPSPTSSNTTPARLQQVESLPGCPRGIGEAFHQEYLAILRKQGRGSLVTRATLSNASGDDSTKSEWLQAMVKAGLLKHNGRPGRASAYTILA